MSANPGPGKPQRAYSPGNVAVVIFRFRHRHYFGISLSPFHTEDLHGFGEDSARFSRIVAPPHDVFCATAPAQRRRREAEAVAAIWLTSEENIQNSRNKRNVNERKWASRSRACSSIGPWFRNAAINTMLCFWRWQRPEHKVPDSRFGSSINDVHT